MRSLLIVSAGEAAALPAALAARPGAIVFDLGDADSGDRSAARREIADLLATVNGIAERPWLFVRIAALRTGLVDADLDAILAEAPDAIVAPGVVGARDIEHLGAKLAVREATGGRRPGATGLVAVAGDSAQGILALATLPQTSPRVVAIAFDGAAFGGTPDAAPVRTARGALVLAAMAAGVPALDFSHADPDDVPRACALARRDGFAARLARHPEEVATIEACLQRETRPAQPDGF